MELCGNVRKPLVSTCCSVGGLTPPIGWYSIASWAEARRPPEEEEEEEEEKGRGWREEEPSAAQVEGE